MQFYSEFLLSKGTHSIKVLSELAGIERCGALARFMLNASDNHECPCEELLAAPFMDFFWRMSDVIGNLRVNRP